MKKKIIIVEIYLFILKIIMNSNSKKQNKPATLISSLGFFFKLYKILYYCDLIMIIKRRILRLLLNSLFILIIYLYIKRFSFLLYFII